MGMKGKRMIAGILLVGIILVTLTGCKNTDDSERRNRKTSHHAWGATAIRHTII